MRFIPISSSQISSLAYDPDTEKLYVQFNSGTYYKYDSVPESVVMSILFEPGSQGKAFDTLVKKAGYQYTKLTDGEVQMLFG